MLRNKTLVFSSVHRVNKNCVHNKGNQTTVTVLIAAVDADVKNDKIA